MKSPNIFAGLAVVITISIIGYIGIYKIDWDKGSAKPDSDQANIESSRDIFSYVPADTLFFFGGLSTLTVNDAINIMNAGGDWVQHAELSKQLSDEEKKTMPSAALMVNGMMSNYVKFLKEPQSAGDKLGVGERLDAISYTIGFIPKKRVFSE